MPSNYTENYELSQWVKSDKVLMEDFNRDNEKIDAALKTQADALTAEKNARETAAATERAAWEAAVAAESAARTSAMRRLGNCRVECFSVYDDGKGGGVTLNFSGKPVVFLAYMSGTLVVGRGGNTGETTGGFSAFIAVNVAVTGGCSFTWDGYRATTKQLDLNGRAGTFQIAAFYAEDNK